MTRRTAYVNARLLDPASGLDARGALLVEGSRIADFGPALFADGVPSGVDEVVDLGGQCLAPGLVDMRVLLGEPGQEHKETVKSASRAAAAGGVTAMVCLPNTDPVIDDVAGIEFIARRARDVKLVKIFAYGAVTRDTEGAQITEMGLLAHAGAVAFTDGTRAIANAGVMRRALAYSKAFGKVIVQHPEEPALASGVMNSGEIATRLGLAGIPREAEIIMIERDLRLVELTGGRIHFAHVSTGESVDIIRRAKARGLKVTCDTAPHYFALTETDVGDYRTFAKVSPPLRGEMDRRAIVEGLADGTIDAIASDHVPQDQDTKRVPFAQAAFGVIGLETLLPLTLELAHKGKLSLLKALGCVTCAPAAVLGLPLGRLARGAAADLVVFDADVPWTVDVERFRSKSKNSPFEDRPVQGRALRTIVDGRTVWQMEG
ncbi:dihydroorotase [Azospirillum sp.]|uniref:dihydroorotase n=1 Tax=Azospirillum sp. TaxID=34012 RepID=UPI002D48FAD1|nr:dihydroorotase [Azospirillum sp.]HYD66528.1 dihydroorotase [Azospirillum sp.]